MPYHVYIAELEDGRFYVGITCDLSRRDHEHEYGNAATRTSRVFGFRKLLYSEPYPDRFAALKRERQIKGWTHAKKAALITGDLKALKSLSRSRRRHS